MFAQIQRYFVAEMESGRTVFVSVSAGKKCQSSVRARERASNFVSYDDELVPFGHHRTRSSPYSRYGTALYE